MNFYLVPVEQGRRIVLDKAIIFIGRHPECDIVLSRSRKISRRHCCFAHVNDGVLVRDLGSMNGVRINGQRVKKEARLSVGDEVVIADLAYVLKAKGADNDAKGTKRVTARKPKQPKPAPAEPEDDPHLSQDVPVAIDDEEEFEVLPLEDDDSEESFSEDDVLLVEDPSEH